MWPRHCLCIDHSMAHDPMPLQMMGEGLRLHNRCSACSSARDPPLCQQDACRFESLPLVSAGQKVQIRAALTLGLWVCSVTEAGEGEDGRMKSAIGIGSLLMDGLGDTIRVSLTEDPELEINPCRYMR